MTILLGIDLETTALEIDKARIVEIGIVQIDYENRCIIECRSQLIRPTDGDYVNMYIPPQLVGAHGVPLKHYLDDIDYLFEDSDFIVAHNGHRYDQPILLKRAEEVGYSSYAKHKPWIDTMIDIPYPKEFTSRKLSYLATDHGFMNPFPHRALFDTVTMMQILMQHDLTERFFESCKTPFMWVVARVSYEKKDDAKSRGFIFDGTNKLWVKEVREALLDQERSEANFTVVSLDKTYEFGKVYNGKTWR